jgi:protein-disulfide isomerase
MKRFASALFLSAALATAPVAFAADAFTPAQQAQIQDMIAKTLKDKPQIIIDALQAFQQKQYEQAAQTIKGTQQAASKFVSALFNQAGDPIAGNPNGKLTVVEFFDYQCPHCVDMNPVIDDLVKSNNNVRIIFKEFPIRGPLSEFAARAALAANLQGKYMAFHDALMKAPQPYTEASILSVAQNVGLAVDKLKTDMNSAGVIKQIQANMKLGQDLKLLGTPAFFIGKTDAKSSNNVLYVPGQMTKDQLNEAINKASA